MQHVMDLFCGCGGFSEGLRQAGFRIVAAVDSWPVACESHRANHPDTEVICADLLTLDPATLPHVDVVIGSPPCPDFSVANNQRNVERGLSLVRRFFELVEEVRPKWYVGENVPGLLSFAPFALDACDVVKIFNAADYGVPQVRRRVFFGRYPEPPPSYARSTTTTLDGRQLKPWVSVREALGFNGDERAQRAALLNGSQWGLVPLSPDEPASTITNQSHWGSGRFRREKAALDAPSHAVLAGNDKGWNALRNGMRGELRYRRLTVAECAILQGFPPDYIFCGNQGDRYKQIGNAVCPPMSYAIGLAMLKEAKV